MFKCNLFYTIYNILVKVSFWFSNVDNYLECLEYFIQYRVDLEFLDYDLGSKFLLGHRVQSKWKDKETAKYQLQVVISFAQGMH